MLERKPSAGAVYACGILSGLLMAGATAQIGIGLVAFVALAPLLRAIDLGASPRRAGAAGWLGGIVFFGLALAWIPLAGFRGRLLALVTIYVLGISLGMGAYAAALAWLRHRGRGLFLAAAPLLWIAFELLRSRGSLGYPWHHLGYSLASYPFLIQLAALGGLYALSLWIVSVNTALVAARGRPAREILAGATLLALPLLLGLRALGPPDPEVLRVAAVQPGVMETGRVATGRFHDNLRTLLDLTHETIRSDPDLVVWPESAFERTIRVGVADPFLGSIALHFGTSLLTGAWRLDSQSPPALYNSSMLVRRTGEVVPAGDKVHPVPFYEGRPTSGFQGAMAGLGLWPGRFLPGERPGIAMVERDGAPPVPVGILICLDSSYAALSRDLRHRGARLLVEISNEAQTGPWSARQHALVSRLRAVETGVPLVRVGNIGPTEWIDARGRVLSRLAAGVVGTKAATMPLAREPTPYQRLGDAPVFGIALLPLLALGLHPRRRDRGRSSADPVTVALTPEGDSDHETIPV